jgi:formate hydrogenlyase subunit 6/NADH:ubiquinone oxidoreductase subunit I
MVKRKPVVFDINWSACIRCGACVAVCPQEAGFTTPFDTIAVDTACDIACMACEKICPVTAITWHLAGSSTLAPTKAVA